jgi:ubiquinone/menaquinone biosynthesis C-methylase UbiE
MSFDEEPIAKDAYDELADTYAEDVETNGYNADIEFPGTTGLIPGVNGKRVLDAGCGTGVYTEWLLDHGADVVGVDVSETMLEHAMERVKDRATFHQADLGEPLDFAADDEFDGIVSALALGHIEDWRGVFSEFARVLGSGDFVVFSTSHPLNEYPSDENANYFEVEPRTNEWPVEVPYYRRPFAEIIAPVLDADFRVDAIAEPQPTDAFEEKRPEKYEKESKQPVFLCLRAVKP